MVPAFGGIAERVRFAAGAPCLPAGREEIESVYSTGKEKLIDCRVYMLLIKCLKIVKKMLLSPTQGRTPTLALRDVGVINRSLL